MNFESLQVMISNHIEMRLRELPARVIIDIYAASLYMDITDIEEPRLTFSINTKSQIAYALAGETQAYGKPSDEDEAKWNYAFWLRQPYSTFLIPDNSPDCILWHNVCNERGIIYDDSDEFDIDAYERAVGSLLAELAIEVAKSIHKSGVIIELFRENIPIIIHELEYHDETAKLTQLANPPSVADEFIKWVTT
jgi:hypothetical protein